MERHVNLCRAHKCVDCYPQETNSDSCHCCKCWFWHMEKILKLTCDLCGGYLCPQHNNPCKTCTDLLCTKCRKWHQCRPFCDICHNYMRTMQSGCSTCNMYTCDLCSCMCKVRCDMCHAKWDGKRYCVFCGVFLCKMCPCDHAFDPCDVCHEVPEGENDLTRCESCKLSVCEMCPCECALNNLLS